MCGKCELAASACSMLPGVILPSTAGTTMSLCPVASIAPASRTTMWPEFTASTASCGRRQLEIETMLAMVPLATKWTAPRNASPSWARILAAASAE